MALIQIYLQSIEPKISYVNLKANILLFKEETMEDELTIRINGR